MAIHRLSASSPLIQVTLRSGESSSLAVALIDTGASITAVHPELVRTLNPQTIDIIDASRVDEPIRLIPTYYLRISLENQVVLTGVEVVAAVPSSPCQVLIGRDLMSRWLMSWDGPADHLIISY